MIRAAHEQTEIDSVKKDLYEKRSDLTDLFCNVWCRRADLNRYGISATGF